MSVTDTQSQVGASELSALESAFELFTRQTEQLQQAYDRLQREAESMNLELEAVNRRLEAKVRELDETINFQQSMLESIPTAVVVTDLEGRIRTYNTAAEQLWRVPRTEALGRHVRDVMGDYSSLLESVLDGERRHEGVRREFTEPEPRIISSTAALVEDSEGNPIGAVQTDHDLSRVCALEAKLRHQEKLADLGRMAAGLAHEIRKPLNGIKGFASLLERRADDDETDRRYVGRIVESADRLNGMLGRILDFAKPDALKLEACDLQAEAREVADFVTAEDPSRPAVISLEVEEDARAVLADRNKIKQVLLNLVKNAVDAQDGEGTVWVTAACNRDGADRVTVSIRDGGRGIPPEKLDRIMEPFYTEKQGGTGLGLAIVHRILQLHETHLEVDSEVGKGTCMRFVLPRAAA